MKCLLLPFLLVNCLLSTRHIYGQIVDPPIVTGEIFKDIDGNAINAHGAGVLYYNQTYYLFGEIKKGKTWFVPGQSWEDYRVPAGGISCYSSKNLADWKYEGVALAPVTGNSSHDLDTGKVIERPKVIYNRLTKKFIMWMHIDSNDYSYSRAGVAVSDNPTGPYTYLRSVRPNRQMSRDMTLFKDDNDKAYLIYSSENNNTMHVLLLTPNYLSPTKTYRRIFINKRREAPAMFKSHGKYYLITSGCTGWSPNRAMYAVASRPLGPWKGNGNPCSGFGAQTTYEAQSTYVLPVAGKSNAFVFMADRWNKRNLQDSRYVWLPLRVNKGKVLINWPTAKK